MMMMMITMVVDKEFDKIIVLDNISGLTNKSQINFSNLLTVSRKFDYS